MNTQKLILTPISADAFAEAAFKHFTKAVAARKDAEAVRDAAYNQFMAAEATFMAARSMATDAKATWAAADRAASARA